MTMSWCYSAFYFETTLVVFFFPLVSDKAVDCLFCKKVATVKRDCKEIYHVWNVYVLITKFKQLAAQLIKVLRHFNCFPEFN